MPDGLRLSSTSAATSRIQHALATLDLGVVSGMGIDHSQDYICRS